MLGSIGQVSSEEHCSKNSWKARKINSFGSNVCSSSDDPEQCWVHSHDGWKDSANVGMGRLWIWLQKNFWCLPEIGWNLEDARILGGYKFFWICCEKQIDGVGLFVVDRWIEQVLDVKHWSESDTIIQTTWQKRNHLCILGIHRQWISDRTYNVHFFHAQLGLDVFPDMRPLHISLNTAHSLQLIGYWKIRILQ